MRFFRPLNTEIAATLVLSENGSLAVSGAASSG